MATPLDEMLVSLCRPERLLDLARRFTLFDAGAKKVARHQQFFAVKDLLPAKPPAALSPAYAGKKRP